MGQPIELDFTVVNSDVVEFSSQGYKVEKIFAKKSIYPKEIIEFSELVYSGGVKKCQNLTFKVNFQCQ